MKHDLWGLPLTLSIIIFYYTNFIARDSTLLFFMGEWYTIIYFTFLYPILRGYLLWVCVLGFGNCAAVNMEVHNSSIWHWFNFLGWIPRNGMNEWHGRCISDFWRICSSTIIVLVCIPTDSVDEYHFPLILTTIYCFLIFGW